MSTSSDTTAERPADVESPKSYAQGFARTHARKGCRVILPGGKDLRADRQLKPCYVAMPPCLLN